MLKRTSLSRPLHMVKPASDYSSKPNNWVRFKKVTSRHGKALDCTIASSRRSRDRNFLNSAFVAVALPDDIAASRVVSKMMRSWRTGSSCALSVAAIRSFRWRAMKSRSKRIFDEEPWRSAFIRERALPSDVRGPVLLAALRLLAAICFSTRSGSGKRSTFAHEQPTC